jgi:release factor glutamine methyltransferase
VLIPRPETELLVIALLDHVRQYVARGSPDAAQLEIADVGTGSGVLAVCAAKFVPTASVTAIDISPDALAVARRNAERHGVGDRIEFLEGDLLSVVPAAPRFDYILSNPPYVSTAEMAALPPDVRNHEPEVALRAGERGTDVIAPLVEQAAERLKPAGVLLIEVSPMIATTVEQFLRDVQAFDLLPTIRDLAGHPRVVQARRYLVAPT